MKSLLRHRINISGSPYGRKPAVSGVTARKSSVILAAMLMTVSLLILAPTLARAAEFQLRPGMTGVADLGAIRCETYNAMYPNGPTGLRQATLYYAEGYIYGRAGKTLDELLAGQSVAADWDFDSLTDLVVDYCANNPEARVSDSVAALFDALN